MSDSMIMDAVKAFLKPIIAEAIQEAGVVADNEPIAEAVAIQPSSEEAALPESDAEGIALRSKYYTIEEVKTILHIGTTSVYNLFKRKKLTKLKVLGKTVVLREELDNAVEEQSVCRYKHGR